MARFDFSPREKIPVAVLGATGCVGQKMISLLDNHPFFRIAAVCASDRSVNKSYREAVHRLLPAPISPPIDEMQVLPCRPDLIPDCTFAFSALDSSVAGEIETRFAEAGKIVVSNSRNHRMDPYVPLVVGEVNPDHLGLVRKQSFGKGMIVTNPNCSVIGIVLALKPLIDRFGISSVQAVTLQAISGAGYPGIASLDILDNVVPYISGEEEKILTEPLKILGRLMHDFTVQPAEITIGAQCNRVPVSDGHTACVTVKFRNKPSPEEIITAWEEYRGEPQRLRLPSAPERPIYYFHQNNYPQPKLHRDLERGMAVSIGRLNPSAILDYQFTLLSHNTVRGAAGSALLNAELLYSMPHLSLS